MTKYPQKNDEELKTQINYNEKLVSNCSSTSTDINEDDLLIQPEENIRDITGLSTNETEEDTQTQSQNITYLEPNRVEIKIYSLKK